MNNELFFLSSSDGRTMTKKFSKPQRSQPIKKESYPHVFRFTSHNTEFNNTLEFTKLLKQQAKQGACLLKGYLSRELNSESRAGTTNANEDTSWLVLDFDGFEGITNASEALELLGISETNYVVQYSASMGIINDSFNAHIFLLLDNPVPPSLIKLWLKHKNLNTPMLTNQIKLTRSFNALRWPLDITVNQNDKLIYIAPPELYDGIKDPYKSNRIQRVSKARWNDRLNVDIFDNILQGKIDQLQIKRLNELRVAEGLPRRTKTSTKQHKGVAVLGSPTQATVSGVKEDRGYVYLNLNGGDSWAYYFPLANPEILYNFKGEDNYALKDIAPEIYKEYSSRVASERAESAERRLREQKTGILYHAFLDTVSDSYYRGTYNHDNDTVAFSKTNSLVKVQHFLKQHGQEVGDFVPEWNYEFRFDDDRLFDPEERFINRYERSEHLRVSKSNPTYAETPIIDRILTSVIGDSEQALNQFLNWLAYIIQYRKPARTAWLMHGTQGTGKGVLFNHILAPLVGRKYVQVKRLEEIEEDFNAYMQDCIFLLVDEVQISNAKNRGKVMAKLLNLIVEPTVSIRAMRTDGFMAINNLNIIFASNKPDPIEIDPSDRRMNVGDYQANKLKLSSDDIKQIELELPAFTTYLMEYEVDERAAHVPMESHAKDHIKFLTRTSIDLLSDALRDGDIRYFFDGLPSSPNATNELDMSVTMRDDKYKTIVADMFEGLTHLANGKWGGKININREDLRFVCEYLIGKIPDSPSKFTSFVKHHNIDIRPLKIDHRTVRGIIMPVQAENELVQEWRDHWLTAEERKNFTIIKGGKK